MVLFEDAQCPYCRDFEDREMPGMKDLVRTGKLKVNMRLRAFLGEDSITAAKALYAASEQNKMFELTILYANQGEENSGWVTEKKLREIFGAVPGLDVDRVFKDAKGAVPTRLLGEAETLATRYGSQSTPDVYVGTSENNASKVDPTEAAVKKAVAGIRRLDTMADRRLRLVALVLAVAGIAVTTYLTYIHYADIEPACSVVHGCEKVLSPKYAMILGIPLSLLGLIGYVAIAVGLLVDGERGRMIAGFFCADRDAAESLPALSRGVHA